MRITCFSTTISVGHRLSTGRRIGYIDPLYPGRVENPVRLGDLKSAYYRLQIERTVERLQDPDIVSLPDLSLIQQNKLDSATGSFLASALYTAGKRLVFSGRPAEALRAIEFA